MPTLSDEQKNELRKKYEKLGPHQGGLGGPEAAKYRQLETDEIIRVFDDFERNEAKWQGKIFTDLEDHFRNVAILRNVGQKAPL